MNEQQMSRITVTRGGIVVAVYFNREAAAGERIARMTHGSKCKYVVEPVAQESAR